MSGAAVTPSGVREGDPAALAALATVRGPSVLAYCRQVAGEANAGAAAADAFARFRQAVVEAGDTASLNPEALLISATRTAAAGRAVVNAAGECVDTPRLLAARADRTASAEDVERLERHLDECWACRAPVARFKAAERAYLDPPEPKLEPAAAEQILAALVAAVPPPPAPEPPPAEATNGAAPHAVPVLDPDATQAFTIEAPAAEPPAPDVAEYDPADVAAAEISHEPAPRARRGRRAAPPALGGRSRGGRRRSRGRPQPAPSPAGAAAAAALAAAPASEAAAHEPVATVAEPVPSASGAIAYETAEYAPRPRERRGRRSSRRLPLVLPIVLVVMALLVALFVSGVFGGDEPASSPRVSAPAAEPDDTTPADLVVVPGAEEASGDEVELAKARDRARARGETLPSDKKRAAKPRKKKATATTGATPPPPPPPPAAASTPAANTAPPPPPPPPPPAAKRKPSTGTRIDTGSSATGAEQIPPPSDTSGIPDLAPPSETATSP